MLFFTSARSSTTILYVIVLAALTLLATTPLTAEAGCGLECTPISTKILFCGNIKNGFQDTMPTIGIDPQVDNCLCTQENVRLYRNCLGCKDLNNAINITNKFITDCKITNSNRNLINGGVAGASALPSTASYAVLVIISVAVAAALGH
ncbi:hypothetical protein EDD11_004334 [Mortierella claussenii]|nr:hypothetical protein EDD11_004334 [Mortierella claussenii]